MRLHLIGRMLVLVTCVAGLSVMATGCATHEKREVRYSEEQHEGEVVEEQPGEMIVE